MSDLVAFLKARLDEDEAAAKAATPGPWRYSPNVHWRKPGTSWFEEAVFAGPAGKDATCVAGTGGTDDPQSMDDAAHIARHDPARVLREVEAKRRIIQQAEDWQATRRVTPEGYSEDGCTGYRMAMDWTLSMLALPYDTHPDYDDFWRP